eukprot:scaffold266221_cov21-Tisochrysis_lutea.AAC.1
MHNALKATILALQHTIYSTILKTEATVSFVFVPASGWMRATQTESSQKRQIWLIPYVYGCLPK